ncbi:MAG: hypothetical protein ACYSTF_03495 [Planctomycetota bacterium]
MNIPFSMMPGSPACRGEKKCIVIGNNGGIKTNQKQRVPPLAHRVRTTADLNAVRQKYNQQLDSTLIPE